MNTLAQKSGPNILRMNTLRKTDGGGGEVQSASMRRIVRSRQIQIHMDSRQVRCITVAVRRIGLRTSAGPLLLLRRLRKLPNLGIKSPTGAQSRRPQSTPVRGRTSILIHPKHHLGLQPAVHPSPNILSSSNGHPRPVRHRLTTAIDPRPVAAIAHSLHPTPYVPKLTIRKPATLLLVQKDDRAGREVLPLSSRNRSRPIRLPLRQRRSPGGPQRFRNLSILTAIREDQKTKAVLHQNLALAPPVITRRTRRISQPVPNKREVPPQPSQSSITRIFIPVKPKMSSIRRGGRSGSRGANRLLPKGNTAKGQQYNEYSKQAHQQLWTPQTRDCFTQQLC